MKIINQLISDNYAIYHGDSCEVLKEIPDNSIHFTIYSPPFESLYTYSNSERDLGNSKDGKEFWEHYRFIIGEQFRTTMPGRLNAIHCMNLPTSKARDGWIGLRDFRGEIIREFEKAGFIYHSEVVIWKDPLVAMQRTKALGLLHKQICKDSTMCRQGVPDYLVVFRKPGDNPEPVSRRRGFEKYIGDDEEPRNAKHDEAGKNGYSHIVWQRYASPVWMDINPSNTLQRESAREQKDERHICPLQLEVIERAVELWTNEGDTVASWFAGIGSEGYEALKAGRKFVGCELKESYYKQAVLNLRNADRKRMKGIGL